MVLAAEHADLQGPHLQPMRGSSTADRLDDPCCRLASASGAAVRMSILLPKLGKFAGRAFSGFPPVSCRFIQPLLERGEMGHVMREDQTSCNDEAV